MGGLHPGNALHHATTRTLSQNAACLPYLHRMVIAQVWDGVFGGRFLDREHAIRIYREHIANVKKRCDAGRLLVFEASEGWQPLCEFLGVPVPEGPYPHLNDAKQLRRMITIARVVGWSLVPAVVLGAGLLIWG
jgi:hypothetical protein